MSNSDITLSDAIDFFKAAGMHVAVVGFDSPPPANCDVAISKPEWKVYECGNEAVMDMSFEANPVCEVKLPKEYIGVLRRIAYKHNHSLKRGKA